MQPWKSADWKDPQLDCLRSFLTISLLVSMRLSVSFHRFLSFHAALSLFRSCKWLKWCIPKMQLLLIGQSEKIEPVFIFGYNWTKCCSQLQ